MPGNTPTLNLPTPLGDDPLYVSDDTIRAAITGIESAMVIGKDTRASNELPERYPKCVSLMHLSADGAVSGDWGYGSGAILTCYRSGGDVAWQIYLAGSLAVGAYARIRIGGKSGWGGWQRIVAPGLAKAEASGVVAGATTTTDTHAKVPVTFPGDRFSVAPDVMISLRDTSGTEEFWVQAESITANGFTAHFYRSTPGAIQASWYAVGGIS